MKKIILTVLAIAVAATALSAKPKKTTVTVDFTQGNPFTAVEGESPAKVNFRNPALGMTIPAKKFKTQEEALEAGYIDCPNSEGKPGYYYPFTKQSFKDNGKEYEIAVGTMPSKGRAAYIYISKGKLASNKVTFTFPKVEGAVPSGIKIYTINNNKKVSEKWVFTLYRNSRKDVLAKTSAPEPDSDSVLSATFEGVTPEDNVVAFSYNTFFITKIVFEYTNLKGKKK